jgi:hypothetical protein
MSLDACLPDLERKGEIDVGRSKEARELYAELKRYYERSHDPDTAAALASQKTVERLEAAAAHKKRNLIREITRKQDSIAKMRRFNGGDPAGTGPLDPRAGQALLAFDERAGHNDSVAARSTTIKGRAHGMIAEILARHHANILGNIRHPAELVDVVRELFKPGSTGNDNAAALADAWRKAAEYLRGRYNEAGGQIGKLEHWGLPQSHSSKLVRAAGYDAWRDFIVPLLDRGRMIDGRPASRSPTRRSSSRCATFSRRSAPTVGAGSIRAPPRARCSPIKRPSTVFCISPTATLGSPITTSTDRARRLTR